MHHRACRRIIAQHQVFSRLGSQSRTAGPVLSPGRIALDGRGSLVQVRKKAVEKAILDAARALFTENGYHKTKLVDVAAQANIGVGNIYSYFPSKVQLLYAVYTPWLNARLKALETQLAQQPTGRARLRRLLLGLWQDIPAQNPGLANSLMEALATAEPGSGKQDRLIHDLEVRIGRMLATALPEDRTDLAARGFLSNLLVMAYDGFVINRRIGDLRDLDSLVEDVCSLVYGAETAARPAPPPKLARRGKGAGPASNGRPSPDLSS